MTRINTNNEIIFNFMQENQNIEWKEKGKWKVKLI